MTVISKIMTIWALMAIPGIAYAHGPEPHTKTPNVSPSGKSEQHSPGNHGEALGEPGDPKSPARTVLVMMSDEMRFVPNRLEIKRGETVRLMVRNPGKVKHEMVLGTQSELLEHAKLMQQFPEMEHEDPNTATAEPGKTATLVWKFTKPGEFMFGCLVPGHFESGMKGTFVVK